MDKVLRGKKTEERKGVHQPVSLGGILSGTCKNGLFLQTFLIEE